MIRHTQTVTQPSSRTIECVSVTYRSSVACISSPPRLQFTALASPILLACMFLYRVPLGYRYGGVRLRLGDAFQSLRDSCGVWARCSVTPCFRTMLVVLLSSIESAAHSPEGARRVPDKVRILGRQLQAAPSSYVRSDDTLVAWGACSQDYIAQNGCGSPPTTLNVCIGMGASACDSSSCVAFAVRKTPVGGRDDVVLYSNAACVQQHAQADTHWVLFTPPSLPLPPSLPPAAPTSPMPPSMPPPPAPPLGPPGSAHHSFRFETAVTPGWSTGGGNPPYTFSRRSGSTPSSATGPASGFGGTGYYYYAETSSPRSRDGAMRRVKFDPQGSGAEPEHLNPRHECCGRVRAA